MLNVLLLSSDPEIIQRLTESIPDSDYDITTRSLTFAEDAVGEVRQHRPDIVIVDHGVQTVLIVRVLRKSYSDLPCVVVIEDEGSLFLNNLDTPRVQYLSSLNRNSQILLAIEFSLAGKTTVQRIHEFMTRESKEK